MVYNLIGELCGSVFSVMPVIFSAIFPFSTAPILLYKWKITEKQPHWLKNTDPQSSPIQIIP